MNEGELIKNGWEKRNTLEEPRLSELCGLYEELGFEVYLLDYVLNEFSYLTCNECMKDSKGKYKIIFTKKKND